MMRKCFSWFFLIVLSCSAPSKREVRPERYPTAEKSTADVEITRLVSEIESGKLQLSSIEELLKHLPAEMFHWYTLAFYSKSAQEASVSSPRVLMKTKTGKTTVTFNGGDPGSRQGQSVELMQFRDETQTFELRDLSLKDGRVMVSEKNPKACLHCHGSAPRPIWEPYDTWSGFVGGDDDLFWQTYYQELNENKESGFWYALQKWNRWSPDLKSYKNESAAFFSFQKMREQGHLRYSLLKDNVGASERADRARINLTFSDAYLKLHAEKLARQVWNDLSSRNLYQIFVEDFKCLAGQEFVSGCLNKSKITFGFDLESEVRTEAQRMVQIAEKHVEERRNRLQRINGRGGGKGFSRRSPENFMLEFAYMRVMYRSFQLPEPILSLELDPEHFGFFAGGYQMSLSRLVANQLDEISAKNFKTFDPESERRVFFRSASFPDKHSPLSGAESQSLQLKAQKALIRNCSGCHMQGSDLIPAIGFHKEDFFKSDKFVKLRVEILRRIALPIGHKDSMPPMDSLDEKSYREIKEGVDLR